MTHPVAMLVLIALISAVATGLFRWLKRELGDHTRQDLVKCVSELIDNGRSGYERGRRNAERGRDVYDRGRDRFSRNASRGSNDDDDRGDTDAPLTGKPAAGRPPTEARQRVDGGAVRPEVQRRAHRPA